MPSPPASESGRRVLLAAGTARFNGLSDSDLPLVPQELARIVASFEAVGYKRAQAELSLDPDHEQLRKLFADVKHESRAEDIIVAYYTGHGCSDEDERRFYLLANNSDTARLDETALAAEDLARALTKGLQASQVLMILDACFSAKGAAEFSEIANSLAAATGKKGPQVYIISAATSKQEAAQGALSAALARALSNEDERLGARTQAFLGPDEVMEAVNSYLDPNNSTQTASSKQTAHLGVNFLRGRCRLFPNPRYQPEIRPGLDLETQRAFAEHWAPKARGAELGAAGWYFTGREQVLKELAAWLMLEQSDGRTRIVTGGPGCGKSAVLARLVTLADPTYRNEVLALTPPSMLDPSTIPPAGVINIAVHVRHKLLAEVVQQISAGLSLTAHDPTELVSAIEARPDKTVIVIDALDEADDHVQIVARLLRPLSELPKVFLLVGARPDSSERDKRFRALGENTVEIDLDDLRYMGEDDVPRYVERRLLASEEPGRPTPYRGKVEIARTVARGVAQRAGSNFLVAHTTAQALLSAATVVDTTQPGWVESLPTGLDDAFARFLAEIDTQTPDGLTSEKIRAALLPLAFAEGEGLPWADLWAPVASAIAGSELKNEDISSVRKHAAAFIIEALEQHRSVYRVYHERLAESLRGSVADTQETQRCIVAALRSRVPASFKMTSPDWTVAHPYILAHFAAHAQKAGLLPELARDAACLSALEPIRVIQSLSLSLSIDTLVKRIYDYYSLAYDRLADQPPDVRLSYLEMIARQQGDDSLVDIWSPVEAPRRWRTLWARCQALTRHRTISTSAHSVALGKLDGRTVIVTGGNDGTVGIRDLASGQLCREPLRSHDGPVMAVALGELDGRAVIVTFGVTRTVRVWDLASGEQRGKPLRALKGIPRSVALGEFNGQPVIITATSQTAQVWDLASAEPRGEPLPVLNAFALGKLDGRPVMISGNRWGTVHVWDLGSSQQFCKPIRGDLGIVTSLALGKLDGTPVIVTGEIVPGEFDGTVRVWDLASGEQRGKPLRSDLGMVTSVALGDLDGQPLIVSGNAGSVQVWDLTAGEQRGDPLRGHTGFVTSVALEKLDGRPVIVSGSNDQTARVWDIASALERNDARGSQDYMWVNSIALGELDGRAVMVSGEPYGTVRIWDLASGKQGEPWNEPMLPISSVALGELNGRTVMVVGWNAGGSGTMRVWDLTSGEALRTTELPDDTINSVAFGKFNGRTVIVAGGNAGLVRAWDLVSGELVSEPSWRHDGSAVSSVALGELHGRAVIVSGGYDCMVRIWDLALGKPYSSALRGHKDCVLSVAIGEIDGRTMIASGGSSGTVGIWDLAARERRPEPFPSHDGQDVNSVVLGVLDGRGVIVSGSDDGTLRVWDADGNEVFMIRMGDRIKAMAYAGVDKIVVGIEPRGLMLLHFGSESLANSGERKVSGPSGIKEDLWRLATSVTVSGAQ